jgi:Helix-turn-helix.
MNLGQKIEQLLKTTAMTKVELAKKLGLKDSSVISHWVKNRFKPDRKNITKLSQVFKKPISYFDDDLYCAEDSAYKLTEKKVYELLSSLPAAKRVAVLGEAGQDFFDLPLYSQAEEFLPIMLEAANYQPFALKVLTQEACPWANEGEYVICVSAEQTQNGKLYLIKTPKGYTIKRVYAKNEETNLKDFKGKTETFKTEKIKIFAQILAFYRKPL